MGMLGKNGGSPESKTPKDTTGPSDCVRFQDLFSDHIDGILDSRSTAILEAHLRGCEVCQQDLRQLRQAVAALKALPPLQPPAYFAHAVRARVEELSRPRQSPLAHWFFPNRQAIAIRLLATALLLAALIPQTREPVRRAGWSLLGSIGVVSSTPPRQHISNPSHVVPSSGAAGRVPSSNKAVMPEPPVILPAPAPASGQNPAPSSTTNGAPPANEIVAPPASLRAPVPLQRPAPIGVSVGFNLDGQARPGAILQVSAVVTSVRDQMGSEVDASISRGARFVSQDGGALGTAMRLFSGNLPAESPTATSMLLTADQPGVYDLRIVVRAAGHVTASDLLLPVGLAPTPARIDTTSTGPTDLYTALSTLAAQSARPIAVEDGLTGTMALNLHPRDFASGLAGVAQAFGCGWYVNNGMGSVTLHPSVSG
ncbi:MAG TPA: zf-HC2 domain-containing protein [Armatimonadota bacterium]|nr:zf-HC2 domain-containing protein [Armatimonadota bacterium]